MREYILWNSSQYHASRWPPNTSCATRDILLSRLMSNIPRPRQPSEAKSKAKELWLFYDDETSACSINNFLQLSRLFCIHLSLAQTQVFIRVLYGLSIRPGVPASPSMFITPSDSSHDWWMVGSSMKAETSKILVPYPIHSTLIFHSSFSFSIARLFVNRFLFMLGNFNSSSLS